MASLQNNQRLPQIDLIRGIALLGIFLMNIDFMSTDFTLVENWSDNFSNPFDFISGKLKFLFLQQRFIGMFSLLFGLSIAIQQQNFKNTGKNFTAYYFKRSLLLALIGVVQILFFFMGDVLLIYSLLSIVLFCFFKLPNKVILASALLIFFVPAIFESIESYQAIINGLSENIKNHYTQSSIISAFQTGTLWQAMQARVTQFFYYDFIGIMWNRTALSLMLLGYLIGKNNLHINYLQYWTKLKIAFAFYFLAYAAFIVYFLVAKVQFGFLINMAYNLHILLSVATYIFIILFIYKHGIFKKGTSLLVNVGKTSLSNYLLQGIICAFIFTSYGFGLFAKTSPTQNTIIVCSVYIFQLLLTHFYLRKFKIGPLEFLWRKLAN
ncbi:MAG TPA: DUF418 domain-containing protein [Bacteroidia bacterium]|jgi:uncharacterized protein|nr:DUF418 domain-containing protein [Bacteroidia bacterium]